MRAAGARGNVRRNSDVLECMRMKRRQLSRRGGERRNRRDERGCASWIVRAGRRCGEARRGVVPLAGHHGHHRAVMRTVPPAAGRQAGIVAGLERSRERPQPEEQQQQDGENTPHLTPMLHDKCAGAHYLGAFFANIGRRRSGIIDSCSGSSLFHRTKEIFRCLKKTVLHLPSVLCALPSSVLER